MIISQKEKEFLVCVRDQRPLASANRYEDRARQRMRRLGYAEFIGKPKRWRITDAGRAALANMENGK